MHQAQAYGVQERGLIQHTAPASGLNIAFDNAEILVGTSIEEIT